MATTRTQSRNSNRSTTSRGSGNNRKARATGVSDSNQSETSERPRSGNGRDNSAFAWGKGNGGALVGATLAGVAIGLAANLGRKFLVQSMSGSAGDWDQVLATEHDMALAIFDKMLATDATQSFKRSMLLMKLTHALDKHAHEEEMVVYPALREANEAYDADLLEGEHGYVKTFIFELNQMGTDAPNWLEKVRQFRDLVHEHARMEEQEVFPRFKQEMSEEENAKITSLVNRDGFWMA
jgi:hemerythrin superfamily protein